mmetsp:Transcript_61083/g.144132  ORF Transcript_61083/g.144132 Transcript_61083/m.144132 type:complete len:338 (+) Transcript_61083:1313-2326(+)
MRTSTIFSSWRSFQTECCSCLRLASASSARFSAAARSWMSCSTSLPEFKPMPGPAPSPPRSALPARRRASSSCSRSFAISRLWLCRSSASCCALRSAPSRNPDNVRMISASLRWSCSSACRLRRSEALCSISRRALTSCCLSVLLLSSSSVTCRCRCKVSSSALSFASFSACISLCNACIWPASGPAAAELRGELRREESRAASRSMSNCIDKLSTAFRLPCSSRSSTATRSCSCATTELPCMRSAVFRCKDASLALSCWITVNNCRSFSPTTAFPTLTISDKIHPPSTSTSCPCAIACRCVSEVVIRCPNSVWENECEADIEFAAAMLASSLSDSH